MKEVCEEVWWKFTGRLVEVSACQKQTTAELTPTSGSFEEITLKLPLKHFDFGGLLILNLAAYFAHSAKPKVHYEVKVVTLQVDFESEVKAGKVEISNFRYEVIFLTCLSMLFDATVHS